MTCVLSTLQKEEKKKKKYTESFLEKFIFQCFHGATRTDRQNHKQNIQEERKIVYVLPSYRMRRRVSYNHQPSALNNRILPPSQQTNQADPRFSVFRLT